MTTLSEVVPGDVLDYGVYGPCEVSDVCSYRGGWSGNVRLTKITFTCGLSFTAGSAWTAKIVPPDPPDIWECYSCGATRPSLDKGFNTTCDKCGSYELHLTDIFKAKLR